MIRKGDRVHCDGLLAHRDDGWVVTETYADGMLRIDFIPSRTAAYLLAADCIPVPSPLMVGDRVLTDGGTKGTILAMKQCFAWVDTEGGPATFFVTELRRDDD